MASPIADFKKIIEDFGQLEGKDYFKGSVRSVKELSKQIESARSATTEMFKKNLVYTTTQLDKVTRSIEASAQEQVSIMRTNLQALQKAQEEQNQAEVSRLEAVMRETQARYDAMNKQQEAELGRALRFYKQNEKAYEAQQELLKSRKEKVEELGYIGAKASAGLEGLESALTGFTESLGSMDNLASKFKEGGSALSKGILLLQAYTAKKAEAGGGEGGVFGSVSKGLLGLSKGVLAITAVVGGAVAIFKVMQGLEEKVKGFNKELINSVGVNDLLLEGTENLGQSLDMWRRAFSDADYANEMGMTLDELKNIPGQLKSANLIVKDFGGSLSKMKDFIYGAKSASVSLGVSFESALERSQYFKEELGIIAQSGDMLSKLTEEFANIRDMAVQSGYSTEGFYQKIKGLVDGMDNMNNRVEEAGKLLISFTRVLGAKGANAFLSAMGQGLGGEGYTDLIKRQILTGRKRITPILQSEAEYMHKMLTKDYQSVLQNDTARDALAKAGLEQFGTDMGKDMKSLQKMTTEQQEDLVSSLLGRKETEGLGREIQKLILVAKGGKEGATRTDISSAVGEVGAAGSIALKYAQLEAHLAGKSIDSMSDIQKLALEQFSGLSKEQIEQFRVIQRKMRGDLRYARDLAKSGQQLTENQMSQLEKMGLKVEGGKVLSKDTGREVKTEADYLLAQREALESMKEATDAFTQEGLLQEVADNTLTSADMINNHLGEILMTISGYVNGIFNFMDKATDSEDKVKREAILGELANEIRSLNEQNKEGGKEIRGIEAQMKRKAAELAKQGISTDEDAGYQELVRQREQKVQEQEKRKNRSEVLKRQRQLTRSGDVDIKGKTASEIKALGLSTAASQLAGEGQEIGLSAETQEKVKQLQELRTMGFTSIDEMIRFVLSEQVKGTPSKRYDEVAGWLSNKGYAVFGEMKGGAVTSTGARTTKPFEIGVKAGGGVLVKGGDVVHALEGTRATALTKEGEYDLTKLKEDRVREALKQEDEGEIALRAVSAITGALPVMDLSPEAKRERAIRRVATEGELVTERGGISEEALGEALKVPPSDVLKDAKLEAKETTTINAEVRKAEIDTQREAAKKIREDEKSAKKSELLSILKLGAEASDVQIQDALRGRGADANLMGLAAGAGFYIDPTEVIDAQDLYVTRNGVFRLDPQDLPSMIGGGMAFTKPGGAVDQLAQGLGGAGINIGTVTIHVDGSKSPEETGKAVVGELIKLKKRREGKAI